MEAKSKWCKKKKNVVKRESKARVSTNQNKRRWENDTRKAERNHTRDKCPHRGLEGCITALQHASRS